MENNQEQNIPIVDNLDNTTIQEPQIRRPEDAPACKPEAVQPKKCNTNTCLFVCNIILLIGLALLYVFHFTGICAKFARGCRISPHRRYSEGGSMPLMHRGACVRLPSDAACSHEWARLARLRP